MLSFSRDINQGVLEKAIYKIFPTEKISLNTRGELKLQNPKTGYPFEFDVFLPEKHICFEFQDDYHYAPTWYAQIGVDKIQQKDFIKQEELRKIGLDLIVVPFWWDGSCERLISSIAFQRPDLFTSSIAPISLNLQISISKWKIPEVGELMLASFPSDIITFANNISNEYNWWMGEKYDGVRMCWVPSLQKSYTRSGLILSFPFDMSRFCGNSFLDCEIWFGRGNFLESQKVVYADPGVISWSLFRLVAFDIPSPQLRDKEFEIRFKYLYSNIFSSNPLVIPVSRVQCDTKMKVTNFVKIIMKSGGEGVMMRKPASFYVAGRSDALYKFKASIEDSEALVSKIADDHCVLKLLSGETISIPMEQIGNIKLSNGDIVTYNFIRQGSNSLSAANLQIIRIRRDVTWEDLIAQNTDSNLDETESATKKKNRKLMEEIARKMNLDPLSANDWYNVSRKNIVLELPGIIVKYKGSLVRALMDLFPEIGLDRSKFNFLQRSYWSDVENRRKFFLSVAKRLQFDPLISANWYSFYSKIKRFKHGRTVVSYHGKSYAKALISLFPEINLQFSKFSIIKPVLEYWQQIGNRKEFFKNFARFHSFDPVVATNWYRFSKFDFLSSQKSARTVLQYHQGSFVKALSELFPDIGIQASKFSKIKGNHWQDEKNRRKFFEKFASEKGIECNMSSHWSLVSKSDVLQFEHGEKVLSFYNGSLKEALSSLFSFVIPDHIPGVHWETESNRKEFFKVFAESKSFSPFQPSTWYNLTSFDLNSLEYGKKVLLYYRGDYKKAVMSLFPDIGLENSKFTSYSDRLWQSKSNSRKYLHYFADSHGFDAEKDFEKWYNINEAHLVSTRYGKSVVWTHGGNHISTLRSLFPSLKLKISKFVHIPDKFWNDTTNQKEFLEEISFGDPTIFRRGVKPKIKTNLSSKQIECISKVTRLYGNSFSKTLISLFPDRFTK